MFHRLDKENLSIRAKWSSDTNNPPKWNNTPILQELTHVSLFDISYGADFKKIVATLADHGITGLAPVLSIKKTTKGYRLIFNGNTIPLYVDTREEGVWYEEAPLNT